jgi:predicted phosphate transport protein (TIGR00153 family)
MFMASPFEGLQEHAEKVKDCVYIFQQAAECYISDKCGPFERFRTKIIELEREADAVKRRIRGHLPKGTLLPVDKFKLFRYLREQDHVLDAVEDVLDWMSYRTEPGIPPELKNDFRLFVDSVTGTIEELTKMVSVARSYFSSSSEEQRVLVKQIIHTIRAQEHEADQLEDKVKRKIFNMKTDPVSVFYLIRLAETIGSVADYAENSGDMMRAMVAK